MQNIEELKKENERLAKENEELRKELSMKFEYLEATDANSLSIYSFNLSKGIIEEEIVMQTVNGPYKLAESLGLTLPCRMEDLFKPLCRVNIDDENNLYWCLKLFDREFLMDRYGSGKKEVAFEYRRNEDAPGPRYLRQTMIMAKDPVSGDIIVRGNAKDVTNRYRMLGNVSKKDEDVTHAAILQSLSDVFYAVYFIDFKMKSYIPLTTTDELRRQVAAYMNAQEALYGCCDHFVKEEYRDELREFFNLDNVKEKLNGVSHISAECEVETLGWVRASFIVSDWNEDGTVASVIITVLEINHEKQQLLEEQKAFERAVRAEAASQSKTEFLFNMSHDIRTPMNAILGYTDIGLRHKGDADKTAESLIKIKTAGEHLLNLINDILEMSRIEAGKLTLTNSPMNMCKSINGLVMMNQPLAAAKGIDFTADVNEIRNPYVYADELHINEVIINLISNAIKYTQDGGKVRYTARQLGETKDGIAVYQFEIADNGIGMSEEFQTHLFEAFSREESSSVSKIEGAGLGLSIVKRIVDMAGGTIHVSSKPGEGSTFTVELPLRVMTAEEIAAFEGANNTAKSIPSEEKFKGKRVLLVEDNEMNREIANDILSEAGFQVEEAEDGEIAVEAVAEKGIEYYDFILMDIQMPVMNGYEATKAIRALQDGDRIPIIALSANAFEEDKKASIEAGMNDHVAKPIDVKKLFAAMARFM